MAKIIAGGFDMLEHAQAAEQRLMQAGISPEYICKYRVNPAGEHHVIATGGDHDASPGAKHAHGGAVKGAAIGAAVGIAVGAAATPLLGPAGLAAGIGVGAYTGSLVGGLREIDNEPQPDHDDIRPAETLVAVNVDAAGIDEAQIVRFLEECGARQVERAEGQWLDGEWSDFDPTAPPMLVGGRDFDAKRWPEDRPAA